MIVQFEFQMGNKQKSSKKKDVADQKITSTNNVGNKKPPTPICICIIVSNIQDKTLVQNEIDKYFGSSTPKLYEYFGESFSISFDIRMIDRYNMWVINMDTHDSYVVFYKSTSMNFENLKGIFGEIAYKKRIQPKKYNPYNGEVIFEEYSQMIWNPDRVVHNLSCVQEFIKVKQHVLTILPNEIVRIIVLLLIDIYNKQEKIDEYCRENLILFKGINNIKTLVESSIKYIDKL